MELTHGSLSSGIGGFDIGAQANGIKTLWTSEIDPLRQDILQWLIPNATHYGDMRKIKSTEKVNIISFGFPCQDISNCKPQGKGIEGEKSRLWYEGWRIFCRNKPDYLVIENSPNLIHKGLRTILGQLASQGYNAEWQIISCKQFGLPHLRKRLFIVAYSNKIRRKKVNGISGTQLGKIIQPENKGGFFFQSESYRSVSWQDWIETIGRFHHLDDGIPKNILHGILEAAGDTVSPKITSWIFARIKAIEENKI